jgi:hypothetical protein
MSILCNELSDFVMNGCYFVRLIVIPKLVQSSDVLNYCESCQTEEFL